MAHITTLTRAHTDIYNSNANTYSYSGSFETFKETEVIVKLDGVALTYQSGTINESASPRQYTVNLTDKTIHIGGGNLSSGTISIYPETDLGDPTLKAPYTAGSAITASDLTNNQKQVMRKAMELDGTKLSSQGDTMTGHLTMGEDQTIIFEGATDDAHKTTITVADPTANRTITFPNVTGTVITTGDTGTVAHAMLAGDAVDGDNIADNSVNTEHIVNSSITAAKLGTINLADLSNVHTSTPSDGQVLKWDNSNSRWEPAADSGGGGGSGMSELSVDTSPQLGGTLDTNGQDVEFKDVSGATKIKYDASQDQLEVNDNAGIVFGNHPDVALSYSNGNDFYLTGIYNGSDDIVIGHNNNSGTTIPVIKAVRGSGASGGGSAELWWNDASAGTSGARQLATSADGLHCDAEVHCQAGLNTDGDVVFNSGTTNMNILWDASDKTLEFADNVKIGFGADGNDFEIYHDATDNIIQAFGSPKIKLRHSAADGSNVKDALVSYVDSQVELYHNNVKKFETSSAGATVTGTCTATAFSGDGSALTGIAAGATGGGSDEVFWENGQTVTTNYTITNNKNAMSAGPITINNGIAVTIGTGENWTIV